MSQVMTASWFAKLPAGASLVGISRGVSLSECVKLHFIWECSNWRKVIKLKLNVTSKLRLISVQQT